MDYSALENDIVARLESIDNVQVLALPETDAEFARALQKTRINVAYKESKYGNNPGSTTSDLHRSSGPVVQNETIYVEVIIQARKLRGADQVYDVASKIRSKLLGWSPMDCHKMHAISFGLAAKNEDNFIYSFVFATTSLAIEEDETVDGPPITAIAYTSTTVGDSGSVGG